MDIEIQNHPKQVKNLSKWPQNHVKTWIPTLQPCKKCQKCKNPKFTQNGSISNHPFTAHFYQNPATRNDHFAVCDQMYTKSAPFSGFEDFWNQLISSLIGVFVSKVAQELKHPKMTKNHCFCMILHVFWMTYLYPILTNIMNINIVILCINSVNNVSEHVQNMVQN